MSKLRAVVSGGVVLTVTAGALLGLPATAAIVGDFEGGADADHLEVSGVITPPGCAGEGVLEQLIGGLLEQEDCDLGVAQLVLGDTEALARSAGGLSNGLADDLNSFGHASQLDPDLLIVGDTEGALGAELLVEANAYQPGGPTEDSDQLLSLPEELADLLTLDVATSEASAIDVGAGNATCPDVDAGRVRVAHGRNDTAGLQLLGAAGDLGLVSTDPEQVSHAFSEVALVDARFGAPDDGVFGVESTASLRLAPINLLLGNIEIDIEEPKLVVWHDGTSMDYTYDTPIVTINGETIIDGGVLQDITDPILEGLAPLFEGIAPLLAVEVSIAEPEVIDNRVVVTDVVHLSLVLGDTVELLSISLGDLSASALTPPEGVTIEDCDPISVSKESSVDNIAPGASFDYLITVTNEDTECTLTDVRVVDTITGPAGSEVTATSPTADSVDGLVVTWNDVGPIGPGDSVTVTITVAVPLTASDGDVYEDEAVATGVCDGRPGEGRDRLSGPDVTEGQLPKTGGGLAALGALSLLAAAVTATARRRNELV